jgi:hypothetical protein
VRRRQPRAQSDSRLVAWESDGAVFYLREQAERCRRLARSTSDSLTQERLFKLAAEYEAQAEAQDDADEEVPALRRARRDDEDDD